MNKEIYRVEPIVKYPKCIKETGKQGDCFTCENREECLAEKQPRCMCTMPYPNHPKGCPFFNKNPLCPPKIKCMFDQIFDMNEVYAIVTEFDRYAYFEERRKKTPNAPEWQITNQRQWQPKSMAENDDAVAEFYHEHPELVEIIATRLLECMGVDVIGTMKNAGLEVKFPVEQYAYRVAFAAKLLYEGVLEQYDLQVHVNTSKKRKGVKTIISRL